MRKADPCAKCGSLRTFGAPIIIGSSEGTREPYIEVHEHPDALLFKGPHKGTVRAWICGNCGYTELYTTSVQALTTSTIRHKRNLSGKKRNECSAPRPCCCAPHRLTRTRSQNNCCAPLVPRTKQSSWRITRIVIKNSCQNTSFFDDGRKNNALARIIMRYNGQDDVQTHRPGRVATRNHLFSMLEHGTAGERRVAFVLPA